MMPALIAGASRRGGRARRATELLDARRARGAPRRTGPASSRAASSSASRWRARWCSGRGAVLADEPTGNLDPDDRRASVQQLLLELNRERGITLVVVTHNDAPRRARWIGRCA